MTIDQGAVDFLSGVVGIVEASSFEQLKLWEEYKDEWEEDSRGGPLFTVGELAGAPICIALRKARVKGHLVAFMEATSQVLDYRQIDRWIFDHLPEGAYRCKVDAMNFHNVFPRQGTSAVTETQSKE